MHRRGFLKGAAGVTVLVAGGTVWRAHDKGVFSAGQGPAYEPWNTWRSENSGPLALVKAAILAASTFNTQPWLFKISDSSIDVYVDSERNLGVFDPYRREQYISIGCALENLAVAALPNGFQVNTFVQSGSLTAQPLSSGMSMVARVQLIPVVPQSSELYDAIPHRHTNRSPFDYDRAIPRDFIDKLSHIVDDDPGVKLFLFVTEQDRKSVVTVISEAAQEMSAHSELFESLGRWFHAEWKDVQKFRDGTTFGDGGEQPRDTALEKFLPESVLNLVTPSSTENSFLELMLKARLIAAITVPDRYGQADNVRAGKVWQRAHLLATARGIAGRPANQAVQLMDHERMWGRAPKTGAALAALIGDAEAQPTFMFYMGYAHRAAGPTARRAVQDVMI